MKRTILAALLVTVNFAYAEDIKHRFVATDENHKQLVHVDEKDDSKNWTVQFPGKQFARDIQVIGDDKVMVSIRRGYLEYSLIERKLVKKYESHGGVESAVRLPNGHTLLASITKLDKKKRGVLITELDKDDKEVKKISCPEVAFLRLMRPTAKGTFLTGSGPSVMEVDSTGKVVWKASPQGTKHSYKGVRLPNGNTLASGGYGAFIVEVKPSGEVVRKCGGKGTDPKVNPHFCADFQLLKNGNIVMANWLGHGKDSATKGCQLVEYDPRGKVVWTWKNPELCGSLVGIVILDDVDTKVLNTDMNGVVGPAAK
jgi:hypothetical protein